MVMGSKGGRTKSGGNHTVGQAAPGLRPVGAPVSRAGLVPLPGPDVLGRPWVALTRLSAAGHVSDLFDHYRVDPGLWTYMPAGPWVTQDDLRHWAEGAQGSADPAFYAICDPATGTAMGQTAFMRIDRANAVIEIGNIMLSPPLQGTRMASAALMAMIAWAFDAGYRRVEWKCDALNAPSRRAALRLGFTFEGLFRQHMMIKGRNRDTAWFAITDTDFATLGPAYAAWLSPDHFDDTGQQRLSLSDLTDRACPGRRTADAFGQRLTGDGAQGEHPS